jgi:hypothetical protein
VGVGGICVGDGDGGGDVGVNVGNAVGCGGSVEVKTTACVGRGVSVGANNAVIVRLGVGEKNGVGVLAKGRVHAAIDPNTRLMIRTFLYVVCIGFLLKIKEMRLLQARPRPASNNRAEINL